MQVCVAGAGYVGLVTAAGLAELGNDVTCLEINRERVERLRAGEVPIFEPGLGELMARNRLAGRLRFTSHQEDALRGAEVVMVAVGTPGRCDGGADLSSVFDVVQSVVELARRETVIVVKSTVPVGTNRRLHKLVEGAPVPIHLVSNPEFLKEGDAVRDFMRPDRIIIGVVEGDVHARRVLSRMYKPLHLDRKRILFMNPQSAELCKYVSNSMLAMRISFMNEVAGLCEQVGADVHEVRLGVGSDSRIGPKFLYASPGYGGSCFPKDVQALICSGREHGVELELPVATHRVNERQKGLLLRKLKRRFGGDLRGVCCAVWGVSFKPMTDDVRESPALTLLDTLLSEGAHVRAHDPAALQAVLARFEGRVRAVEDAYDAAIDADALVLVTEWSQYKSPDFTRLLRLMRGRYLLDGRNIWSSYALHEQGFIYEGIGTAGGR